MKLFWAAKTTNRAPLKAQKTGNGNPLQASGAYGASVAPQEPPVFSQTLQGLSPALLNELRENARQSLQAMQTEAATGKALPRAEKPLERLLETQRQQTVLDVAVGKAQQQVALQQQQEPFFLKQETVTPPPPLSPHEQTVVQKALTLAHLFEAQVGGRTAEALYQHPAAEPLKQLQQKEPYLDRFTRLIALHLAERLSDVRFREEALHMDTLRQDNLVLARYVQGLLQQTQALQQHNNALQQELALFQPALGGFYRKQVRE
jgi:ribosomal protein L25 (general stress protein Ctc)